MTAFPVDTALPTPLERSMWTTPSSPELHTPESSVKRMEGSRLRKQGGIVKYKSKGDLWRKLNVVAHM